MSRGGSKGRGEPLEGDGRAMRCHSPPNAEQALMDLEHVPVGIYAEAALKSLGFWERDGAIIGAERSGPASTLIQRDAHGS